MHMHVHWQTIQTPPWLRCGRTTRKQEPVYISYIIRQLSTTILPYPGQLGLRLAHPLLHGQFPFGTPSPIVALNYNSGLAPLQGPFVHLASGTTSKPPLHHDSDALHFDKSSSVPSELDFLALEEVVVPRVLDHTRRIVPFPPSLELVPRKVHAHLGLKNHRVFQLLDLMPRLEALRPQKRRNGDAEADETDVRFVAVLGGG
jgi:hypothetical protein